MGRVIAFEFVVALPDCVDVGNIQKLYLAVDIKFLRLIALACYFVAKSCHFVSGIVDNTINVLLLSSV